MNRLGTFQTSPGEACLAVVMDGKEQKARAGLRSD